jgi:hypothetical protein
MVSVHRNPEHRSLQVEHPGRLVEEVVLLGRKCDPTCLGAAANTAVHSCAKIADPRTTDDAGPAQVALQWSRQVDEVRVSDQLS